jgi:hypothetical protein
MGCPIRISADNRLLTPPRSFSQLSHVLLRLLVPRHPPYALSNLTKNLLVMSILHLNRKVYKFNKELTFAIASNCQKTGYYLLSILYYRGA